LVKEKGRKCPKAEIKERALAYRHAPLLRASKQRAMLELLRRRTRKISLRVVNEYQNCTLHRRFWGQRRFGDEQVPEGFSNWIASSAEHFIPEPATSVIPPRTASWLTSKSRWRHFLTRQMRVDRLLPITMMGSKSYWLASKSANLGKQHLPIIYFPAHNG